MAHPHNSEFAPRIFLKLYTMKGANRYIKVILMIFTKKPLFKEMDYFGSENGTSNSGLTLRIFLRFCTMKGANRYLEIILTVFPKNHVWGKWDI